MENKNNWERISTAAKLLQSSWPEVWDFVFMRLNKSGARCEEKLAETLEEAKNLDPLDHPDYYAFCLSTLEEKCGAGLFGRFFDWAAENGITLYSLHEKIAKSAAAAMVLVAGLGFYLIINNSGYVVVGMDRIPKQSVPATTEYEFKYDVKAPKTGKVTLLIDDNSDVDKGSRIATLELDGWESEFEVARYTADLARRRADNAFNNYEIEIERCKIACNEANDALSQSSRKFALCQNLADNECLSKYRLTSEKNALENAKHRKSQTEISGKSSKEVARQELVMSEAAKVRALKDLTSIKLGRYVEIVSPMKGTATKIYTKSGVTVMSGSPLVEIADSERKYVSAVVDGSSPLISAQKIRTSYNDGSGIDCERKIVSLPAETSGGKLFEIRAYPRDNKVLKSCGDNICLEASNTTGKVDENDPVVWKALFNKNNKKCVFAVVSGIARETELAKLSVGDTVITTPKVSDLVDGSHVTERGNSILSYLKLGSKSSSVKPIGAKLDKARIFLEAHNYLAALMFITIFAGIVYYNHRKELKKAQ